MRIITAQAADGRWNYGPEDFRKMLETATTGNYPTRFAARVAAIDTAERHSAQFPGAQLALDLS